MYIILMNWSFNFERDLEKEDIPMAWTSSTVLFLATSCLSSLILNLQKKRALNIRLCYTQVLKITNKNSYCGSYRNFKSKHQNYKTFGTHLLLMVVPRIPIQVPMIDPRTDQYLVFSAYRRKIWLLSKIMIVNF